MIPEFSQAVLATIERERLVPRGATVVVALSGGADSMALLRALLDLRESLGVELVAAHVDHALRAGSAADAAFAREWAGRWKVSFREERIDWKDGAPSTNVEAAARDARYAILKRIAGEPGAVVAVGHHAEDRLETFLCQLIRGAGPRGLSQPRYRREDGVIRPLLDRTRPEIQAFLEAEGIPWRTDPTNLDGANLRSRIRRDVIPLLTRENPEIVRTVGRTAHLLAAIDTGLGEMAAAARAELTRFEGPGELVLDGGQGHAYHPIILSALVREAIRSVGQDLAGIGFDPVDRTVRAWRDGGKLVLDLPGDVRVAVDGTRLRVFRTDSGEVPGERELPVPGEISWEPAGRCLHLKVEVVEPAPDAPAHSSGPRRAWLDADRVAGTLRVRSRRPGDRYRPLGLRGSVKLQDLLVNGKIPRERRDGVPVVVDEQGILWVPGFRVDERARITEQTKTALRIEASSWTQETQQEMSSHAPAITPIGNVLYTEEQIQKRVRELGAILSREYRGRNPILVNILKGGFIFLADLVRAMDVHCEMDFMVVSSYEDKTASSGVVRILSDLGLNIEGRHVLIVEDIVDTGLTLDYIRELLLARNPESLKIVSLLDKVDARGVPVPIDYVGFEIPNEFVVGYGLDVAQRFRNLPYITVLEEGELPEFPLSDETEVDLDG